jgi:2-keto-4-pentenoate hydratase/2-oxohepta-3-ene-1,7-dioic acid hydratase in catechol pathway
MITHVPGFPELPIGTLFCIGRNYAEHARELNNPVPENPIIFTKPISSVIVDGNQVVIPSGSTEVHHEAEMVVLIGRGGRNIPRNEALQHVLGYGIGIDITARDVQSNLKDKGHPWLLAKGLDTFAPLGTFVASATAGSPSEMSVRMLVNGEIRQDGNTKDLLFPVDDLIARLSSFFTLRAGDLIFTGTPAGVGPLRDGDSATAVLGDNVSVVNITVKQG